VASDICRNCRKTANYNLDDKNGLANILYLDPVEYSVQKRLENDLVVVLVDLL
jgi:hypothetical protein